MSRSIAISGDGLRAVAIYDDKLHAMRDLLGKPEIERASHVRWDDERELWVAYRAEDNSVLCEHKNREDCLKEEVRLLTKELIHKL